MIYIFTKPEADDRHFVETIHYRPDLLSDERKAEGLAVPSIPEPEERENQAPTLYYNPLTVSFFYEYREIVPVEDPEDLKARIEKLEAQLAALLDQQ